MTGLGGTLRTVRRQVLRCPLGFHDWRQAHGYQRLVVGHRWFCVRCPSTSDAPLDRDPGWL